MSKALPPLNDYRNTDPSFLDTKDERFREGAPRVERYFYALTLRDIGTIVDESNTHTTYAFEPTYSEREEFPELKPIVKVLFTYKHDDNTVTSAFEYGYSAFTLNGRHTHQHTEPFATFTEALAWVAAIGSSGAVKNVIFRGQEPWVARLDDPLTKLS